MSPEDETIQMWHDRDKSGWWILFNMDQIIGQPLALVENGLDLHMSLSTGLRMLCVGNVFCTTTRNQVKATTGISEAQKIVTHFLHRIN